MTVNSLEPAYVLHQRKYRETSLLVDLLTKQYGVVRVVANGACRAKSPWRGILQSFIPLRASWSARHELGTLTHAEMMQTVPCLQGHYLLSGFYLNELIVRLIHPHAPVPDLFAAYQTTHQQLVTASQQKLANTHWHQYLRIFEKRLLNVLGISMSFHCDCFTGELIEPMQQYRFVPEYGFSACQHQDSRSTFVFRGDSLLALANEQFTDAKMLYDAKRLMRAILQPLLGRKQLYSRQLF